MAIIISFTYQKNKIVAVEVQRIKLFPLETSLNDEQQKLDRLSRNNKDPSFSDVATL